MKNKIHKVTDGIYVFHCPGCGYDHPFHTDSSKHPTNQAWQWNGSFDKPTISPSLLIFKTVPEQRCHSFIKDGFIQFLDDCFHDLKGKTVEIPEYEE